eukprot:6994182-Prymnesium_polylepis.1
MGSRSITSSRLDRVGETLVVSRKHHVARARVGLLQLPLGTGFVSYSCWDWGSGHRAQLEGDREDLRLRQHGAQAARLRPLLVVHVALRVRLDLDEPADVDVAPAGGDGARAARACASGRRELLIVDHQLALGDRDPQRLVPRRRVVEVTL